MGIIIMTIHLNIKLKKEVWDTVECRKAAPLSLKTFSSISTNLIKYSVTKFIPATLISIVTNLAPVVVVVLAFVILKEKIRRFDVLMIVLTLVGIFIIILGSDNSDSGKDAPPFPYWVIYLILMAQPFLSAGGTISMRKMPKFSDAVVSWYIQWTMLIASAIIMLVLGEDFAIFARFGAWEWLLAFGTGFTAVYLETARFKALKLYKAAAL